MNSKGYLDISFSWIFAILVGGAIIFGAVYGLNKFMDTSRAKEAAETGTDFSNLLSSLETDIESGKIISIGFPLETRLSNECKHIPGTFGEQSFSINEKIKNEWGDRNGLGISSENRYVFSESRIEGKNLYSFSKPLEMPFKVADLIYLFPKDEVYCFSGNFNLEIEDELEGFNHENLLVDDDCDRRENVIEVCFSGGDTCEIDVNYGGGSLTKDDETFYFTNDALMYAAIFSDKEIYDCEVKRILYRAESLAELYYEKGFELSSKGCESPILQTLNSFKNKLSQISSSDGLGVLDSDIDRLETGNRYSNCRLW